VSKDIPIIFSGPMVRALLEGRKTMTRRVLKPQPEPFLIDERPCDVGLMQVDGDPRPRVTLGRVITKQEVRYAVGDRLWVREAWQLHSLASDVGTVVYRASINGSWTEAHELVPVAKLTGKKITPKPFQEGWRPAIHQFRELSRLTLIVKDVKIERLQEIPLSDVRAEGCEVRQFWLFGADGPERQRIGAGVFGQLWTDIHDAESWAGNPFVIAISFRVIKANIDAPEARVAA
jgi:hypothetical protein